MVGIGSESDRSSRPQWLFDVVLCGSQQSGRAVFLYIYVAINMSFELLALLSAQCEA
jgi:hypothetical protein